MIKIQFDRRVLLAEDKLYKAEYLGSGTFVISKPKRKKHKITAVETEEYGTRLAQIGAGLLAGAPLRPHDAEQPFECRLLNHKSSGTASNQRCGNHQGVHV